MNFVSYQNGNYTVHIDLDSGTKIRENDEDALIGDTVENFDLCITKRCNCGCDFCFMDSKPYGEHADLLAPSFIDKLHPYTEIAIGGGNPLEHPDLIKFLEKLHDLKQIPSMTVNQIHFEENFEMLKGLCNRKLIYGLGVSLVSPNPKFINLIKHIPNTVVHVIAGLLTETQYRRLVGNGLKVLILGYKEIGRGMSLVNAQKNRDRISANMRWLEDTLRSYFNERGAERFSGLFKTISFDNRALIQLHVKDFIPAEMWNAYYMGNDGLAEDEGYTSNSFYVDLVDRTYAVNSCSSDKMPLPETAEEMIASLKERYAA